MHRRSKGGLTQLKTSSSRDLKFKLRKVKLRNPFPAQYSQQPTSPLIALRCFLAGSDGVGGFKVRYRINEQSVEPWGSSDIYSCSYTPRSDPTVSCRS